MELTVKRFFLVGSNRTKTIFKLLKIDRTDPFQLSILDDATFFTRREMKNLLIMIDEGNRANGGLKKTCVAFGIVGFVRFLQGYYMLLITKRRKVGEIAGHFIYGIESTAYLSIAHSSSKVVDSSNESRYRTLFFGLDLTRDFHFSYTYDLTRTLQYNMTNHHTYTGNGKYQSMFVWNHYILRGLIKCTSHKSLWILPLIHGYYRQEKYSIYGKPLSIALIARRSRYFAGTRFLKRGISEEGHVANEVESEQIVMTNDSPQVIPKPHLIEDQRKCRSSHSSHFIICPNERFHSTLLGSRQLYHLSQTCCRSESQGSFLHFFHSSFSRSLSTIWTFDLCVEFGQSRRKDSERNNYWRRIQRDDRFYQCETPT